jgi:hypothetical protein
VRVSVGLVNKADNLTFGGRKVNNGVLEWVAACGGFRYPFKAFS